MPDKCNYLVNRENKGASLKSSDYYWSEPEPVGGP